MTLTFLSSPSPMEVDSVHLLVDLARMYDSGTEMVVSEAFGNAVDIKSKLPIQSLRSNIACSNFQKNLFST